MQRQTKTNEPTTPSPRQSKSALVSNRHMAVACRLQSAFEAFLALFVQRRDDGNDAHDTHDTSDRANCVRGNDDNPGDTPGNTPGNDTTPRDRRLPTLYGVYTRLCAGLRTTTAAMRPEALKELLWNGFVFLSARLRHDGRVGGPNEPDTLTADDAGTSNPEPTYDTPTTNSQSTDDPNTPLTVDRIRPPPRRDDALSPVDFLRDYELTWREDPRDYITPAGFAAVASLLTAWRGDLEAGTVARCPDADPIVQRFDGAAGSDGRATRLSVVVHNFMLERHGINTEQAWQEAVLAFLAAVEATERWIAVLYAPATFAAVRQSAGADYEFLRAAAQQLWDDGAACGLCGVGDFLAFAARQTHQWGHPGMRTVQAALMKMLVDLEAVHRQQPVLSFVRVARAARAPGYLFADDDGAGVVEAVTADRLRAVWLAGADDVADSSSSSSMTRPQQCRVYGAQAPPPPEALRRARILRAAAQSLQGARRATDRRGSSSLVIAPSQPLLYERYRRRSSATAASSPLPPSPEAAAAGRRRDLRYGAPYPDDATTPAKRKVHVASPDPRLLKRSRLEREKRTERQKTQAAAALAAEAVAAAASIPLPPSPAATEATSEEETDDDGETTSVVRPESKGDDDDAEEEGDDEVDDEEQRQQKQQQQQQQQQRRLPWTLVFPEDEDEDELAAADALGLPRLRISAAKADELRLLAEQRRATAQAARMKREAEQRRREAARREREEAALAASTGLRAPRRAVIGPLSAAWLARVHAAVRAAPGRDVAQSPEGTALTSKDFRTVVSKSEWLNDEIVNGFLLHLARYVNGRAGAKGGPPRCHAFTSFFWKPLSTKGAAGTQRWMKRVGVTRETFLALDTVLVPICEHSHWTLVVVRPRRATVAHLDSLGGGGGDAGRPAVTEAVLRWVRGVVGDEAYAAARWRVQAVRSPRQTNGWDCGVHTLTNALFMALGLDPACYGAAEMPTQRDRIAATLLNGGFSGELELEGV